LSEVYYPRLDTPSVRNLDFMITDGDGFAARAQDVSIPLVVPVLYPILLATLGGPIERSAK
jgi:hypothetical protein